MKLRLGLGINIFSNPPFYHGHFSLLTPSSFFSKADCAMFSWLFLREASWRKRLTDFRATVARIGRLHKEVQT